MMFRYRGRQELRRQDDHLRSIVDEGGCEVAEERFDGVPRAADELPDITKYGEYVKVNEIVGNDVKINVVVDWKGKGDPKYGANPALAVGLTLLTGEHVWCIISQEVLYRKIDQLRDQLPLLAEFHQPKGKRYFDIR